MTKQQKVDQVILFVIDDVKASQFFDLLESGRLPNFQSLAEGGSFSKQCITTFPSVTFPCYPNIITGAYSGYYPKEGSGIPGYHWISRKDPPSKKKKPPFIRNYTPDVLKLGRDLGKNVKTIFEQAGDANFFSSLNVVFRGSYFSPPTKFSTENVFKNIEEVFSNPGKYFDKKEVPKITVGYVPKTDELLHERGFDHPEYINEIMNCDKYIGSLIDLLKQEGYYDSTAICMVSDHGNYKAEKVYDLEPFFQKKGLIPYDPKKGKGDFDANCGSIGHFNFPGDTWHHHPTQKQMEAFSPSGANAELNLFETLWEIPGTKLMYYKDDNCQTDKGTIHVEKRSEKNGKIYKGVIEYKGSGKDQKTKLHCEEDIFGYGKSAKAKKLIDENFHTIEEWLSGTFDIDFPILIDQLPRYFVNPRACDIIISTLGEYAFNYEHGETKNKHVYSHDIALKPSMTVPLIVGGSDAIPKKEIHYCKTTDVAPTLLGLLGIEPDKSVVGKNLL